MNKNIILLVALFAVGHAEYVQAKYRKNICKTSTCKSCKWARLYRKKKSDELSIEQEEREACQKRTRCQA